MRTIERTGAFRRDYKREKAGQHGPTLDRALVPVVQALAADTPLPPHNRDHALSGNWKGYRECHLKPDLLLIYERPEAVLRLVRLGSHSELFR